MPHHCSCRNCSSPGGVSDPSEPLEGAESVGVWLIFDENGPSGHASPLFSSPSFLRSDALHHNPRFSVPPFLRSSKPICALWVCPDEEIPPRDRGCRGLQRESFSCSSSLLCSALLHIHILSQISLVARVCPLHHGLPVVKGAHGRGARSIFARERGYSEADLLPTGKDIPCNRCAASKQAVLSHDHRC